VLSRKFGIKVSIVVHVIQIQLWNASLTIFPIITGDCGACWAITAVETVESAHFIGTGNIYDLSEAEVIMCETSCSMCDGGWPQNAFQWVMDHGGLPLSATFEYNSYTLLEMTKGLTGESYSWTEDSISSQRSKVCPADNGGDNSNDSGDDLYDEGGENESYGDYSAQGRYGNIKGFGYATDRCVCYSDGSGCDCDDQDESTAVRNVASYGPAVVCLEASLWQDYNGGIITSDIGCGSQFLDMNHCVQVVGYAYTDGSDNGDDDDNKSGGSGDDAKREGYWIVRNQWGSSWGMNGYAFVAMGENTCGILNDMTQAYL
jgi:C1A family cysteine protease